MEMSVPLPQTPHASSPVAFQKDHIILIKKYFHQSGMWRNLVCNKGVTMGMLLV